jgi:hypothetical protein
MPFNINTCGILALGFLGLADAHMKMASPVPFNIANLDIRLSKPLVVTFLARQSQEAQPHTVSRQ